MEINVFLVSKPIQYFNSTNIEVSGEKILYVIDNFYSSEELLERAILSKYWSKCVLMKSFPDAFSDLMSYKWNNLFIDSDYGYSKHKYLRKFSGRNIFVFEEGLGTYTKDLRNVIERNLKLTGIKSKIKNRILKTCYKLIGNQDYHGGNKFTKGVIIYDIEKHEKVFPKFPKKRYSFAKTFFEHLNNVDVRKVLYPNPLNIISSRKYILYITSWKIDPEISVILDEYPGYYKLLKPHPHIKEISKDIVDCFDEVIQGGYLVEFLIRDLITLSSDLVIIHNNSASLLYFNEEQFINIRLEN